MSDQFSDADQSPADGAWPEHVPPDLAMRIRDVLSYSDCNPSDVWDELKSWLEEHDVAAPAGLARASDPATFRPGGSTKYSAP